MSLDVYELDYLRISSVLPEETTHLLGKYLLPEMVRMDRPTELRPMDEPQAPTQPEDQ